ncbi:hypothetical protein GCM10027601_20890 [Nocardioides ungokensis]|uniref:hypothetical protein n=1 Tax=Nocardioides ungokensis TaxID=1643322 RepID=UPI0015DE5E59|nr:hypothetical protein [Nocardioides ungokensis]
MADTLARSGRGRLRGQTDDNEHADQTKQGPKGNAFRLAILIRPDESADDGADKPNN